METLLRIHTLQISKNAKAAPNQINHSTTGILHNKNVIQQDLAANRLTTTIVISMQQPSKTNCR